MSDSHAGLWLCRDEGVLGRYSLFEGVDKPVKRRGAWRQTWDGDCRYIGKWFPSRGGSAYAWHPYLRKGRGPIEVDMLKLVPDYAAMAERRIANLEPGPVVEDVEGQGTLFEENG